MLTRRATCSFVLIKGIGLSPVGEWAITSEPWRRFLTTTDSSVRMLAFDYEVKLDDRLDLNTVILDEGQRLINCLSAHLELVHVSR